ncbi:hypothetical protein CLV85_0308 [Salinibacterium amurskyense]|uniref:Uncharacterized protein n=1 Tax=Salinibacterium amurskyense TaxID=205941 RepID=A0A2M9D683_9MICO|nr:hypothetical protein CLV85_0308 [Salinibacterium amurskyense]
MRMTTSETSPRCHYLCVLLPKKSCEGYRRISIVVFYLMSGKFTRFGTA